MTTPEPTPTVSEMANLYGEVMHFERRWAAQTKAMNRRLLFLFTVMFAAIAFFAWRGELHDTQIRLNAYSACVARAEQFAAFNQALPAAVAKMVDTTNPNIDPIRRAELLAGLTLQLQIPAPLCVES